MILYTAFVILMVAVFTIGTRLIVKYFVDDWRMMIIGAILVWFAVLTSVGVTVHLLLKDGGAWS